MIGGNHVTRWVRDIITTIIICEGWDHYDCYLNDNMTISSLSSLLPLCNAIIIITIIICMQSHQRYYLISDGHFRFKNPTNIFLNPPSKSCRYNIHGFVEELPKLPENRRDHACAALPSTGVRPTQPTFCRRLLLREDGGTDPADFHLFTLFSLAQQTGHPSPPFQEDWVLL